MMGTTDAVSVCKNILRKSFLLFSFLVFLFLLAGCEKEQHLNVNPADLHGLWVRNQEYWRFLDNGTGVTWDEAEDVSEQESNLRFEWTLSLDELTCVFRGEMGNQAVPKLYIIREITPTRLRWEDYYGEEYTFSKVVE